MERLTKMSQLKESSMKTWTTIRDKIKEQAVIEAKSSIKIKRVLEDKLDLSESLTVLRIFPLILPDTKVKASSEKIIRFSEVGIPGITEIVQEIAQPELYVLSYGDQLFLIIDCVVVTNVDVELLPLTLLSAYFSDAVLVELLFFFHSR